MTPFSAQNRAMKVAAILVIVAGLLGLLYGGFSYTREKTAVKLGPLELSVKERETVNVPIWLGVGAVVVGGLMLAFAGRK
jgi:TRAP-type C4-dicarboxylate transport system permease small subunit